MVGSAICRRLATENCEILSIDRGELELRDQTAVYNWVVENKPDAVFLAAAKVGGISANDSFPAEFLYDNLIVECNVINASKFANVEKLMFLGSACIYPRDAEQPMAETALLSGPLEPTNEWYAIAKIAGIKLCEAFRRQYGCDFISAMPNNLYGQGDNFDLESSHVVPALIRKIYEAKISGSNSVEIWGTGTPMREFMYVDDCADALVFLMKNYSDDEHVNIGSGEEISIAKLATRIAYIIGYAGEFHYNTDRPDGTPRKLLNDRKISDLGWKNEFDLTEGLRRTYASYLESI
ncbi:MAG: GDP-fucose synthetase [Rhodospirillaceae bacterium]|nr:GDP-fucose synthetase [Rhodospirillaceae bacterium]